MTEDFHRKNKRACDLEQTYLTHFYGKIAARYEFAQGTTLLALALQTQIHIDAVLTTERDRERCYLVEHKFIFHRPERQSRNVTLETQQNSYTHKPGWCYTTQANYILFAFENAPGSGFIDVYFVPWKKLKAWFSGHVTDHRLYTDFSAPNAPEFYIVPIATLESAIPEMSHYQVFTSGKIALCQKPELALSYAGVK